MFTQEKIKKLFENHASLYDVTNTFLSLGIDDFWRRKVARSLTLPANAIVADIATGTAEVAIHIAREPPRTTIVGLDFSHNMLSLGNKKVRKFHYNNIFLLSGDATALPFPQNSFDALTIVFGIRNIVNRELALKEFYSVLKPRGQLVVMEFGFPQLPPFRSLYLFYFNHLLPRIGNRLVSSDHAYTYLRDSVHKFPAPEQFMETLKSAGFSKIQRCSFTGGIVDLFKAVKD
jgi:demethylmenaquinone methyltransferase/2-methoxy-6-polyprenyl-1,4-benzoquinol methylase